jgi:exonuclease III
MLRGFFTKGYDVICIQEATEQLPSFSKFEGESDGITVYKYTGSPDSASGRLRTDSSSHEYTCYVYKWGANPRCSLAIYVKNGWTTANRHYGVIKSTIDPSLRPMLWIKVPATNYIICNVHLPSGKPGFAYSNFCNLREQLGSNFISYVIVGDFNIDAGELHEKCKKADDDPNHFHATKAHTHQGGRTLDYVYYKEGSVSFEGCTGTSPSDHSPIIITLIPLPRRR